MKRLDKRIQTGLLICFAGILFGISGVIYAAANTPKAVTLIYFRATGGDGFVALEWATATELDTAGFRIERAQSASGPFVVLPEIGFIPAAGSGLFGATYSAEDRDQIANDQTYYYHLIEVELDGTQSRFGPISAVPLAETTPATSTSTATSTATPQGSQIATSTPTRTSTPITTSTPSPTSSPTLSSNQAAEAITTAAASRTPRTTLEDGEQGESDSSNAEEPLEQTQLLRPPSSSSNSVSDAQRTPSPDEVNRNQSGYPPATSQDNGQFDSAYPANTSGQSLSTDGESSNLEATEFASGSFNSDTQAIGQGSGDQAHQSNTLFLWVGFLAALLIFIAGILASIYYFDRERTRR